MTIHAYTELRNDYPAFVNLSERAGGSFALTVRSQGDGGRNVGTIELTREQLLNLVNDAAEHLDGEVAEAPKATAKAQAIASGQSTQSSSLRAQALEMALRTPGLSGHHTVLQAASAYQGYIVGQMRATVPCQEQQPSPNIKQMVDRFLGWRLPKTFSPDCGISFDGRKDDEWNKNKDWPIGTNLLNAEEARAMFEHVLAAGDRSKLEAAIEEGRQGAIEAFAR